MGDHARLLGQPPRRFACLGCAISGSAMVFGGTRLGFVARLISTEYQTPKGTL